MSPRAACRLELLDVAQVYDYVAGKADWLAHGLPTQGEQAQVPRAKEAITPTARRLVWSRVAAPWAANPLASSWGWNRPLAPGR